MFNCKNLRDELSKQATALSDDAGSARFLFLGSRKV